MKLKTASNAVHLNDRLLRPVTDAGSSDKELKMPSSSGDKSRPATRDRKSAASQSAEAPVSKQFSEKSTSELINASTKPSALSQDKPSIAVINYGRNSGHSSHSG
jgi:hypothetical protein